MSKIVLHFFLHPGIVHSFSKMRKRFFYNFPNRHVWASNSTFPHLLKLKRKELSSIYIVASFLSTLQSRRLEKSPPRISRKIDFALIRPHGNCTNIINGSFSLHHPKAISCCHSHEENRSFQPLRHPEKKIPRKPKYVILRIPFLLRSNHHKQLYRGLQSLSCS